MNITIKFTEGRHRRIKKEIENTFNLVWKDIKSKSRKLEIIEARRLYCVILRDVFGLSLQKIGDLANTHHATVIHSIKMHNIYSNLYKGYDGHYKRIKDALLDFESLTFFNDEINHLEKTKHTIQEQIDNLIITKIKLKNGRKKLHSNQH
tara:strand:+ start:78 stop:527 length:450 start_codon:yes stop_codon:yes gene_type:complete